MRPMEEHLKEHCRTIVKDFGKEWGRRILRGCIPVWREAYGETVTGRVITEIQKIMKEPTK